jgi:SSS family transporter
MAIDPVAQVIAIVYLVAVLAVGLWVSRKLTGIADFYVADRRMPTFHIVAGLVATYVSTGTFLGYVGAFRGIGIAPMSIQAGAQFIGLSVLLLGTVLWRYGSRFNGYTIPDFLGDRYSSQWVRGVSALILTVAYILYVASLLIGGGLIMQALLGVNYPVAVVVVTLFFLLYTLRGGMLAVFVTDSIQFVTFMIGLVLLAGVAVVSAGGIGTLVADVSAARPAWFDWRGVTADNPGGFPVFETLIIWSIGQFVRPDLVTRVYGARSERTVIKAAMISAPILVAITWMVLLIGASSVVLFPEIDDPENTFIIMSFELLPSWLAAIPVAGVLAAALSTADTQLMACGAAISRDFYERLLRRDAAERHIMRVARVSVLACALIAGGIALQRPGLIITIITVATAIIGGALFAPFVGGLVWLRGTGAGALASIATGTIAAVITQFARTPVPGMLVVLIVALVTYVAVSLMTTQPDSPVVAAMEADRRQQSMVAT